MRFVGWLGIIAGILIAIWGFWWVIFMHFPAEQSVLRLSTGRWDDWIGVLICFVGGVWLIIRGDKLAGGPIRARNRAMVGLSRFENRQRNTGCLTFAVGIGLFGLIIVMLVGTLMEDDQPVLGTLIIGLWLLPIWLIIRGGWRRFSGRGWLFGERPWF